MPKIRIGMRIWKTVIAVFLCAVMGMIFDIHPFLQYDCRRTVYAGDHKRKYKKREL